MNNVIVMSATKLALVSFKEFICGTCHSRLHNLNSGFNTFFDVSVATHVTAPDVG